MFDESWSDPADPPLDTQFSYVSRRKPAAKKRYKKPEGNIQKACTDYMESLGFIVMRTNAGKIEIAKGRWFHGVPEGYADLHCNAWGMFLAVETKAPARGLSPKQREYRDHVLATGGTYIAPHSVPELRAGLCAAYGPQRVAQWEADGATRKAAHDEKINGLKRKMGQIK